MITAPTAQLRGELVVLRLVEESHRTRMREILATPEVARWWGGPDSDEWPCDGPHEGEARYAVLVDGAVEGLIQYGEELDPMYRHAGIDVFLDPAAHGRGYGRDAQLRAQYGRPRVA